MVPLILELVPAMDIMKGRISISVFAAICFILQNIVADILEYVAKNEGDYAKTHLILII